MKRISLLSLALLSLAGVWAQSGTPDPVSVADVQITHEEFAVFKSHDTIMYNPQTGQYDSVTVDDGNHDSSGVRSHEGDQVGSGS